jgi:RHS repeat-associated protein
VHMKTYEQRGHDSNKGDIFAYDGIYRLTGLKFNSPEPTNPASEQFEKHKAVTFDRLSNILSIDETINGQTQTITTDIPADSNYSKLNQYERFDQWGLAYDLNGNLTQKSTQHNVYDYKNRIVRATDVDSTVKFKYDPLGRRIQKEVTLGSQSKTTNFYYSGHQVIEERDSSDQVTRQLIYGNGIDEVIRVDKYTGTTSTSYYFHINDMGSITAVTDANGNIIERVYYDIYGKPTFKDASGNVITKSSIGNNILFQGREYDNELNLYYFRARYYDPIMGRFLSTDPMGYADSMNLYQAFNMNPVNFVDPFGNRIYLTGEAPEKDFILFKNIFSNIFRRGNEYIIDKLLILKSENGKFYIDLIGGKGTLKAAGIEYGKNREFNKKKFMRWIKTKTKELIKYPAAYNMDLEDLFEFMILDTKRTPIEFRTDSSARTKRAGGGLTLEPFETKSGNIEVLADPETPEKGADAGPHLQYFDIQLIIVHEFGHALGSMLGFTSKNIFFWELAIMMENLYRMRIERSWLRVSHTYGDEM